MSNLNAPSSSLSSFTCTVYHVYSAIILISHTHIATHYFTSHEALSQSGESAVCVLFVDRSGKAHALSMCQRAFGALPLTLNLTHIVLWWQQWAFCHLLSSANSMSNYTPATNLITVAEEMGWFNSFQLGLIGPVRSNLTHLRYELPVTFDLRLPLCKEISRSWYDNWKLMVQFTDVWCKNCTWIRRLKI